MYGSGSTATVYEVSTTTFSFDNEALGGGSIASFTPAVKFDLDTDSAEAATSVGGSDGRASFTTDSEFRAFTVQFEGNRTSLWRSGRSDDWAFQAFARSNAYQTFLDQNAMQSL